MNGFHPRIRESCKSRSCVCYMWYPFAAPIARWIIAGNSAMSKVYNAFCHHPASRLARKSLPGTGVKLLECTVRLSHYESADWGSTGLISTTGVPSIASIGPTFNLSPEISRTVTRCKPSGFGRSGDRVAKTPDRGKVLSSRGCTFKMSR